MGKRASLLQKIEKLNQLVYGADQRVGKVKKGWTRKKQHLSTYFVVGLMSL